jgi:hypothetical protein
VSKLVKVLRGRTKFCLEYYMRAVFKLISEDKKNNAHGKRYIVFNEISLAKFPRETKCGNFGNLGHFHRKFLDN